MKLEWNDSKDAEGRLTSSRADTTLGEVQIEDDAEGYRWHWSYLSNDSEVSVTSSDGFEWFERAKRDAEVFVERFEFGPRSGVAPVWPSPPKDKK